MASPHFLTTRDEYRLLLALAASLLLHVLPFVAHLITPSRPPPPSPPLTVTLREPPPAPLPPPPPSLILPEQPKPAAAPEKPPPPKAEKREKPPAVPKTWTQAVSQHLNKLNASGLFYPQEAIAQGIEGEVLVLIIIDESGRVSASRVEESSGHRILDDAALRAVRSLRSLPADAPREALLPVRFRLR
ncbi:MAG: energy transducer TonB [Dechloromonas sp.]|nr:energy transducer TonB [Candidatus Dechloromonas phosphoritropha]